MVDFQITLSTYKLNSQNKKIIYIYKKNKNTIFFKIKKKKHHRTREARVMRLVYIYFGLHFTSSTFIYKILKKIKYFYI